MANPRIPYQMSSERKILEPPEGKSLIVHLVVNVENWVFENAMPRKIITAPHGHEQIPDIPTFSWAEDGMRERESARVDHRQFQRVAFIVVPDLVGTHDVPAAVATRDEQEVDRRQRTTTIPAVGRVHSHRRPEHLSIITALRMRAEV